MLDRQIKVFEHKNNMAMDLGFLKKFKYAVESGLEKTMCQPLASLKRFNVHLNIARAKSNKKYQNQICSTSILFMNAYFQMLLINLISNYIAFTLIANFTSI